MGLVELKTRIEKGYTRISELKSRNEDIPSEWIIHLSGLVEEYKTNAINTLLDDINVDYPHGLMDWLLNNNKSLYDQNSLIEDKINKSYKSNINDLDQFDSLINELSEWYKQAITVYKNEEKDNQKFSTAPNKGVNLTKGGQEDMGFSIEAVKTPEPGVYDVTIADVKVIDGKYGDRLQVEFKLEDDCKVNGFFPVTATSNNKTGQLFKKALGEIRNADSDELIDKIVKILVEEKQVDGHTYTNVSKVM